VINPSDEISTLNNFFSEMKKLEKNSLPLNIPNNLKAFGFYQGNIVVEAFKTHSRTAKFTVSENTKPIGAETSDIVFLITHEYISPNVKTLVDQKISFFQAKIEKNNRLFKIKPRQWYLMRYWPIFSYKTRQFPLTSCRNVPDVCSFYLLLFRKNIFNHIFFVDASDASNCDTNSVCLSTPYMEEKMPTLKALTRSQLIKNTGIPLRLGQKDGDGFLFLLWNLVLTYLGAHDPQGLELMTTMFLKASKENNPKPGKATNNRPSVGIKVNIQLKSEGFPK
jgi:hypothetical protein